MHRRTGNSPEAYLLVVVVLIVVQLTQALQQASHLKEPWHDISYRQRKGSDSPTFPLVSMLTHVHILGHETYRLPGLLLPADFTATVTGRHTASEPRAGPRQGALSDRRKEGLRQAWKRQHHHEEEQHGSCKGPHD